MVEKIKTTKKKEEKGSESDLTEITWPSFQKSGKLYKGERNGVSQKMSFSVFFFLNLKKRKKNSVNEFFGDIQARLDTCRTLTTD